jgi:osmoprotectant transport system substrate-binding protein
VKPSWRRLLGLLLVMSALILAAAACGGDDDEEAAGEDTTAAAETQAGEEQPTVIVGTKNFPEQYILGELYKQALEAKDYTVQLKSDIVIR